MTIPKLNKRKNTARTWLDRLFGACRIDFISPLSLEQCIERLERAKAKRNWWSVSNEVRIELNPIDSDTYRLRLIKKERLSSLEFVGFVKRWEECTSHIMLTVQPQYVQLLVFGTIAIFFTGGLLSLTPSLIMIPVLLIIYIWGLLAEIASTV